MNRPFDPHEILHDRFLTSPTPFDAQRFLEEMASPLAGLCFGGDPVSEIVETAARRAQIDPRVLLAKLEVEQGLVTGRPAPERLEQAMGYGLTDDGPLWEFRDFRLQVTMAARVLGGVLEPSHPFTVHGHVGEPLNVRDGLVVPRNAATAALYRYTPWIGSSDFGGRRAPFGNYLFFLVWRRFFRSDPRGGLPGGRPPAQTHDDLELTFVGQERTVQKILVNGVELGFAPLEQHALRILASPAGAFVDRDELTEPLSVTPNHLYGLISRLRDKIGRSHIEQIGIRTRHHGRAGGSSGYRLRDVRVSFAKGLDMSF